MTDGCSPCRTLQGTPWLWLLAVYPAHTLREDKRETSEPMAREGVLVHPTGPSVRLGPSVQEGRRALEHILGYL